MKSKVKMVNKNIKVNNIKIIKKGKNISADEKMANEKKSKSNMIVQYIIPLVAIIIISLFYIATQKNIFLILFGFLMIVVLFGWDCSSRTCPECKKWNTVIWTKNERRKRKTNVSKRSIFNKEKKKIIEEKYIKINGKCKNCNCEFEIERGRII